MTTAVSISEGQAGSGTVSSKWFGTGVTDQALRLFSSVEGREGVGALLLAANVCCIVGYSLLCRTLREFRSRLGGAAPAHAIPTRDGAGVHQDIEGEALGELALAGLPGFGSAVA